MLVYLLKSLTPVLNHAHSMDTSLADALSVHIGVDDCALYDGETCNLFWGCSFISLAAL